MARRVVYTAIYGGYDDLQPHAPVAGVDFLCFTDDPLLRRDGWQVVLDELTHDNPRFSSKVHKTIGHDMLRTYDQSLWVDGSVEIVSAEFVNQAFALLEDAPIALFRHPARKTILDEIDVALRRASKYGGQKPAEQAQHYVSQGFALDAGHFAGTVIARNLADPKTMQFGQVWLQEIDQWSHKDQISLPYVLWLLDIKPAVFPHKFPHAKWFKWHVAGHRHDEGNATPGRWSSVMDIVRRVMKPFRLRS